MRIRLRSDGLSGREVVWNLFVARQMFHFAAVEGAPSAAAAMLVLNDSRYALHEAEALIDEEGLPDLLEDRFLVCGALPGEEKYDRDG